MKINKKNNLYDATNSDTGEMYFDGSYLENNKTWHLEDSQWKCEQITKLLSINSINPKTVCEVGCGAGEILCQLSLTLKDAEFFGYEISPQAFELCKSKESKLIHFEFGNILEKSVNCDLLLCIDVFEHVQDYMGFISDIKSTATYKVFHIPLDISALSVISKRMINTRKSMGHLHYFTAESAIATLEGCGYSIIDSFYTGGFLRPHRSQTLRSKIARFPRRLLYLISPGFMAKTLGGCSLIVLAK